MGFSTTNTLSDFLLPIKEQITIESTIRNRKSLSDQSFVSSTRCVSSGTPSCDVTIPPVGDFSLTDLRRTQTVEERNTGTPSRIRRHEGKRIHILTH